MPSKLEYKYRWVWVGESGDAAFGTNREAVADEISESLCVIDVSKGIDWSDNDPITEVTETDAPDDDDEAA